MSRKKEWLMLGVGLLTGIMLGPTAARAAEEWLKAIPSTQIFIVDGKQVDLEAYAINGNNYVKLRDIGQAVGFDVSYDAQFNAAVIDSTKPYFDDTASAPGKTVTEEPKKPLVAASTDYAQEANPTVFTTALTKEAYNAIRETVVNKNAILSGTAPQVKLPDGVDKDSASMVLTKLSIQPVLAPVQTEGGSYRIDVQTSEANERAKASVTPFLARIEELTDREKVTEMAYYVADHITYAIKYPYPDEVFGQDGQVEGCCMAYAYSFKTLCDLADIPCIFVSNPNHQWNQVYVDGQWWTVDVTGNDTGDDMARDYWQILIPLDEKLGDGYKDSIPDITLFTKEVLIPGSTK